MFLFIIYSIIGFVIWNEPLCFKNYFRYVWVKFVGDGVIVKEYHAQWRKMGLSRSDIGKEWRKYDSLLQKIIRDYIFIPIFFAVFISLTVVFF